MTAWKWYGWHAGVGTAYPVLVSPPCGVGPTLVKARSVREAARKFWAVFHDIVNAQLCGLTFNEYRKIRNNRKKR